MTWDMFTPCKMYVKLNNGSVTFNYFTCLQCGMFQVMMVNVGCPQQNRRIVGR